MEQIKIKGYGKNSQMSGILLIPEHTQKSKISDENLGLFGK
jgi:hypothetical protein